MSAIEPQIHTLNSTGRKSWRRQIVPVFLWVLFTVGLLTQVFAPRLKIENHAFVMRPTLTSQGGEINPGAIVERDRA